MLCYTAICFTGNCTLLRIISFFLKVDITSVIMQITLVNLVFLFHFLERNTVIYSCLVVGTLCYTPALVVSTEYTMF